MAHVIGAGARLATLPLVVASAAASAAQPAAPYPPNPGYYGGPPGYYCAAQLLCTGRPAYYAPAPRAITLRRRLTTGPALAYAAPDAAVLRAAAWLLCTAHVVLWLLWRPRLLSERAVSPIGAGKNQRRSPTRKARHGGRPSRAAALELRDRILEVATELFLTEGYGSTSIEAVAARAGISKRTFYHRFHDKAALFAAVVHRIIEQIRPPPGVPLLEGATLQEILRRLAGLILRAALSPQAIALHRLVTAESARFPNLIRAVYDEGWAQEATNVDWRSARA